MILVHPQPPEGQHEKQKRSWLCASTVQQQLKHWCIYITLITNPKHNIIQAYMKKIKSIPAKTRTLRCREKHTESTKGLYLFTHSSIWEARCSLWGKEWSCNLCYAINFLGLRTGISTPRNSYLHSEATSRLLTTLQVRWYLSIRSGRLALL